MSSQAKAHPKIPNYEILEKLGEGGMASVWLAQRHQDSRISVIKILHEHLANDRVVQSRFVREAQVAAFLEHPNIARLFDAGRVGESSYLAMEFIAGEDVEAMMMKLAGQRKMVPPELSITVSLRVLEGLHYAHEFEDPEGKHLEIVHRDLSPRNVMIAFDGSVKIIDFGLVRTNLGDFRTAPGMIAGTLRYMSPEQATADRIDRRSDLYTWSVVLYELLTGKPLVTATEARAVLGAVVVDLPPPLSSRNPNLPRGLDAVFSKALEKDPAKRFSSALELHDALALAAGPLGTATPEAIAEFLGGLFPTERIRANERLTAVRAAPSDGPAFDSTRVADSSELTLSSMPPPRIEVTVSEPAPIVRARPRSKLPWALSLAALAVGAAAIAVRATSGVEPAQSIQPPAPPPEERVTVKPVANVEPPAATTKEPPPRRIQRPVKPPPAKASRSEKVEPPSDRSSQDPVATFLEEANAKIGTARTHALYKDCGLAAAAFQQDDELIRRVAAECTQTLRAIKP